MPKRTSPSDAHQILSADDLEDLVEDKRANWRASDAKARRRQRRYKTLLTRQLVKALPDSAEADPDDGDTGA